MPDKVVQVWLGICCAAGDVGAQVAAQLAQVLDRKPFRPRIGCVGTDAEAFEHAEPTGFEEAVQILADQMPAGAEQVDPVLQAVRQFHATALIPKGFSLAAVGAVVQNQEIADAGIDGF
ncbi:hypothetical protein ABAC460_14485 [Asticcacaulis sp. AC460]|nr:hypothetical protein ABAC460_14485 [Asticcacaulis sp. AC460]